MAISKKRLKGRISKEPFENRMIEGLEKIIDGHLLMLLSFPHPDHPDSNRKQVYVDFEFNVAPWLWFEEEKTEKAYSKAYEVLKERYDKIGWIVYMRNTNNGPTITLSYREDSPKQRRRSVAGLFKARGHIFAPWEKDSTRCINPGCELHLELFFDHTCFSVEDIDLQWVTSCPTTPKSVRLEDKEIKLRMKSRMMGWAKSNEDTGFILDSTQERGGQ